MFIYGFELSTIQVLSLIAIFIILSRWVWSRRKLYALSMKVPGPFSLPFIGSVTMLIDILRDGSPFRTLLEGSKKYSGIYRAWLGPHLHLVMINPEDVESVFHKSVIAKPPQTLGNWVKAMGNGLLTMTAVGKESPWKEHKKILSPSLGVNVNKNYYGHILRNCQKLLDEMEKITDKGFVEFGMVLLRFCADSVSESMYGVEMNFSDGTRDGLFEAVETMTDCVYKRAIKIWYHFDFVYDRSELGKTQRRATQTIKGFAQEIFDVKQKQVNKTGNIESPDLAPIELLLEAYRQGQMSENAAVEEIMNMWSAASDTSGIVIQFIVLMFAMHKRCQDSAFREIKEYYNGDPDATVEFQDLSHFKYIDMCIKETLRLFSPGPVALRYVTEEFPFRSRGFNVPPDTSLVIISFLTHRDPKIWDNPTEFRPERFSPEEVAKRHPCSFYAFSGGPRKCGGRGYAKLLLTLAVVHLLRKFEFENPWKVEDLPLKFDIDVRNLWGYKAKITKRNWD